MQVYLTNARPPAPRKPRKQAWPAGSHGAIGWLGGVWNAMPTNQPTLSNGQVSRRLLRGLRGSTMLARSGPQNSATLPTGLNPPPSVSEWGVDFHLSEPPPNFPGVTSTDSKDRSRAMVFSDFSVKLLFQKLGTD
jgi:hypothetical protein